MKPPTCNRKVPQLISLSAHVSAESQLNSAGINSTNQEFQDYNVLCKKSVQPVPSVHLVLSRVASPGTCKSNKIIQRSLIQRKGRKKRSTRPRCIAKNAKNDAKATRQHCQGRKARQTCLLASTKQVQQTETRTQANKGQE